MAENTTTTQIVREAPDIEAAKVRLLQEADRLYGQGLTLPAIEAAGLSATEQQAIDLAKQGQGVYAPYLEQGSQGVTRGMGLAESGAQGIAGLDIAGQFAPATSAMQQGLATTGQLGQYAGAAGEGLGAIQSGQQAFGQGLAAAGQLGQYAGAASEGLGDVRTGTATVGQAASMMPAYMQANLQRSLGTLGAAEQAALGATATGQGAVQQGIAALGGAAQGFDPTQTQAFMNPYQQQVIDEAMRQIERQGDVARQRAAAQAVGAGAFGSTREGVQRAELERALAEQKNAAIVGALSQGYSQAQQAAQSAFEAQQARQLQQAGQYGQLGTQATGMNLEQAAALQGIGGLYGQQALQQAQLGQSGVTSLGQLGAQQAQLGMLPAGIAKAQAGITGQQADIYGNLGQASVQSGLAQGQLAGMQADITGKQAGLYGTLGQGLGSLASSQTGLELQRGTNLANIGSQIGQMGVQQAALGEAAQRMNLADVNALTQLGGLERQNYQTQLDAVRATALQQEMAPYQQLAFVSDIYKGAPSTQMAMTSQSAPSASPFQQTVGTIAGTGAAIAGASKLF